MIPVQNILDQNGLVCKEVGITYQSDHLQVNGQIESEALSNVTKKTFNNDSIKAWNLAPKDLKDKGNIYGAKAATKKFVKMLPI